MKTIAVMTMAFLPGTFFAAVFAIPSLRWDEPQVIQDKFWVYWAFTIPFTMFVFGLWFALREGDGKKEAYYRRWAEKLGLQRAMRQRVGDSQCLSQEIE